MPSPSAKHRQKVPGKKNEKALIPKFLYRVEAKIGIDGKPVSAQQSVKAPQKRGRKERVKEKGKTRNARTR